MNKSKRLSFAVIPVILALLLFVYSAWTGNKPLDLEPSNHRVKQGRDIKPRPIAQELALLA